MTVEINRHRLTVDQYHRMIDIGLFSEQDKVELINGELVNMCPVGSRHAACVNAFIDLLPAQLPKEASFTIQNPIAILPLSEPEPDVVVVKRRADRYRRQHPSAEDIFLVIEVADSSLAYDQEVKLPLYANAGIPVYWIVNLEEGQIEVNWQPVEGLYKYREIFRRGEEVKMTELNVALSVTEILGPEG